MWLIGLLFSALFCKEHCATELPYHRRAVGVKPVDPGEKSGHFHTTQSVGVQDGFTLVASYDPQAGPARGGISYPGLGRPERVQVCGLSFGIAS